MKKTFFMLLGAALMVVAGCKKDDNKLNNGEKMTFTSDLSGGAKTEISGKLMKWTEGDEIVINGKTFTSEISQEGAFATFTGDAVEPTYHAYYPASLYDNGNYVLPATQTYNGTNLSLVNPMYASSENTTLRFHNICALVKLDLTGTDKVKTIVARAEKPLSGAFTVKEENGTFYAELSSKDAATVTLNCGDGVQLDATTPTTFYMALPQGTYENLAFTVSNGTKSTVVDAANAMLEAGHIWNKTTKVSYPPEGALPGVFTVNESGKKVYFSKGNLWYNGSVFHFEENQWGYESYNLTSHVSYFYWCKNASAACASSYNDASATPNDVLFTNESSFQVSEETAGMWRTLSIDEWTYLLNTNNASSNARTDANRFAKAMVKNVNGLLIFPDGYNDGTAISNIEGVAAVNNIAVGYPTSSIKDSDWADMESSGVVFLPAAGNHRDDNIYFSIGTNCNYWSSSTYADQVIFNDAYFLLSNSGEVNTQNHITRSRGYSVRLVSEI